jgi:uncharacterized protein (TIGR02646 family)
MKRIASPAPPARFVAWAAAHPDASWEQFKNDDREAAAELRQALMDAQHQLCAFCEIDLQAPLFAQVEHWHPKDPALDPTHNWGLDFSNLMAGCEGGARPDVDPKGKRWQAPIKKTQRCGQAKGNKVLVHQMLDPRRQVPEGPVWEVDPQGFLRPRDDLAPEVKTLALSTIQHLNLNSKVLLRLRKAQWDAIEKSVKQACVDAGGDEEAEVVARRSTVALWLGLVGEKLANFWTTARAYYGPFAEVWLRTQPALLP